MSANGEGKVFHCPQCQDEMRPPLKGQRGYLCPSCGCQVDVLPQKEEMTAIGPKTMEGMRIGGYRVGTLLGTGSRGSVYVGEQLRLRRLVTLKFLNAHLRDDPVAKENFLEAGRRSASLIHPSIVKVYDALDEGEHCCVVGEFVPGISLDGCVSGGEPLSPRSLIQIALEATEALQYAHGLGVIHGNLCPSNLLRSPSGRILISDFAHSPFEHPGLRSTQIRQFRELFIAPEQMQGEEVTPATDIFCLGAVLFYSLTTYPPYSVQDFATMQEGDGDVSPPGPLPARLYIPPPLANLLRAMLAPKPADRPASMEATRERLQAALEGFRVRVKKTATQVILAKTRELGPARRRLYKRLPVDMDVSITARSTTEQIADLFLSKIANLSENGCFVATAKPMPIGTFVTLQFGLEDDSPPISVLGLVRWVEEDPDRPGMGVQFLEVTTEDRKEIREIVDDRLAVEMCRVLTGTQLHRAVLKIILSHWGCELSLDQIVQISRASKPLLLRTLEDFEHFGLVQVAGMSVTCVRPASRRIIACLVNALSGLDATQGGAPASKE